MTDKPILQPPSQPRIFTEGPDSRYKVIAIIGIVLLVFAAFFVIVILPGENNEKNNSDGKTDESIVAYQPDEMQPPSHEPASAAIKTDQKQSEAKALLVKALKLLAELENQGVEIWGSFPLATSYSQVMESLSEANTDLDKGRFDDAIKGYNQTIEKLGQLSSGRENRLKRSLESGQKAISQFDGISAKQHLDIALAIDPANEEAQTGIRRIKVMDQVLDLVSNAKKHEAAGNLDLARESYKRAISLDGGYRTVKEDLQRINGLILERDFKHAMSDAISALGKKKFEQAKTALNKARALRPDDLGVRDLDQQLEKAILSDKIQYLNKQALQYEKEEQWEEALDSYIKILDLDADAAFAQKGRSRAEGFIKLYGQAKHYIANPNDLQSTEHMDHARKICEMAVAGNLGPVLQGMIKKLNKLIEDYSKAVRVFLQSDNMTDVRIYKVGRFDKFHERTIELRPGKYKAIGTRSGYRDVIVSFTVPTNGEEVKVSLSCREKI